MGETPIVYVKQEQRVCVIAVTGDPGAPTAAKLAAFESAVRTAAAGVGLAVANFGILPDASGAAQGARPPVI